MTKNLDFRVRGYESKTKTHSKLTFDKPTPPYDGIPVDIFDCVLIQLYAIEQGYTR